jgi:hypothetical protein
MSSSDIKTEKNYLFDRNEKNNDYFIAKHKMS